MHPRLSILINYLQVAAAMWKVLTLNVDILPLLPLEQWQTLFSIIAISASSGGFASIKSFEVGLHLYCMCIFPAFTFINFHSQWRGCYTSHVWSQRSLSFASSVCDHCCETHRPPYSYLSGLCIYLHTFTDGSRYDSISVVLLTC